MTFAGCWALARVGRAMTSRDTRTARRMEILPRCGTQHRYAMPCVAIMPTGQRRVKLKPNCHPERSEGSAFCQACPKTLSAWANWCDLADPSLSVNLMVALERIALVRLAAVTVLAPSAWCQTAHALAMQRFEIDAMHSTVAFAPTILGAVK